MKKKLSLLSILFLFLLISCNKDKSFTKNIVGTYRYTLTEEIEDGIIMGIEGTDTYNPNGKLYQSAIITLTAYNEYRGKETFTLDLFAIADYLIKDGKIIFDYDFDKLKIVPQKDYRNSRKFQNFIDEYLTPLMKKEIINSKGYKIIELNDSKLIVEQEGIEFTYYRIK